MSNLERLEVMIPRDLHERLSRLARQRHQKLPTLLREELAHLAGVEPEEPTRRRDYEVDRKQ